MPVKNYLGKVVEKQTISHNTFWLKVQMPPGETLEFQAGQFVNIEVAPSIRRSYSIASSPIHKDYFELIALGWSRF